MNFQEKVVEASALLRERAGALAEAAIRDVRSRADRATRRVSELRRSWLVVNQAGRQLTQVARKHAGRFVKQNSPLFAAARQDVQGT